jgi:hypothetical protein
VTLAAVGFQRFGNWRGLLRAFPLARSAKRQRRIQDAHMFPGFDLNLPSREKATRLLRISRSESLLIASTWLVENADQSLPQITRISMNRC